MLTTASVVAGDASARMTTSMGNTIATEHSHLMMRVLAGGSMSTRSKFARNCNVACSHNRTCTHAKATHVTYNYVFLIMYT